MSEEKITSTEKKVKPASLSDKIYSIDPRAKRSSYYPDLQKKIEQLADSKETAELADREKSEFLAKMSHEIRTPLTSIMGFAGILTETDLTDEQKQLVQYISKASNQLLLVLDDVLDISRIESGKIHLEKKPFNISEVAREVGEIMAKAAHSKHLETHCFIPPNFPSKVFGDQLKLRQILTNILSNAIKFTDKGRIVFSACYDWTSRNEVKVIFEITDTGLGIPDQDINKIFNRFYQVDSSQSREIGGSGLGLCIAKELTELMGGSIDIVSHPGKGSSFYVSIPFSMSAIESQEHLKHMDHSKEIEAILPQVNVLIAEDVKEIHILLALYFKDINANIDFAENGQEALKKFKSGKYDVVLMDMEMPVMDGYEATEKMREWEKLRSLAPVPIIAQTAHALEEKTRQAIDAGCSALLTKPIDRKELIDTVREVCEGLTVPN